MEILFQNISFFFFNYRISKMKIQKIKVYQVDLPLIEAEFKFGPKKSVSTFDSTVVEIETDNGVTGVGEVSLAALLFCSKNMRHEDHKRGAFS